VEIREGIVEFGGGEPAGESLSLTPEAAHAFLGLSGPGGYVALVGAAGLLAPELEPLLPGVRLVAINPPAGLPAAFPASVLRAPRFPLKRACLRGVILGPSLGVPWVRDAVQATLPGLRVVGHGDPPPVDELEVVAEAQGVWVGRSGMATRD
jgi:hypothetical protein